jgi:predicted dehydrogenase
VTKSILRIGVVGCGAVSERCHLPAVKSHPGCHLQCLVDANTHRLRELARQLPGVKTATNYRDVIGYVDAAIVALPHSLHAPVSVELLRHGIHVLVEKPMAMSVAECDAMIQAAEEGNAVLAVGLMRRFLHSARFAKWVVGTGLLGQIEAFDFQEGNIYNWPVASNFFFRKETAGGGVLFDTGAHTLDLLLWWLGDVESFQYCDDSYGGVEADCELRLVMTSGAEGLVELSRTRNLRNTAILRGKRGELEVNLRTNEAAIRSRDGTSGLSGEGVESAEQVPVKQAFLDLFPPQIHDWIDAIQMASRPAVPGEEGRRSVALIEACYAQRQPLELPWMRPGGQGGSV